jgi:diacylglycerol kinase (ATP)
VGDGHTRDIREAITVAETRRSILIVVNPTAGRGRSLRTADAVAGNLDAQEVYVDVRHTSRRGEAEQIIRQISTDKTMRPDCVVACGGDGTMQEVANALASLAPLLADTCPVMGLAPSGRCNDFARALGVPSSPEAIADVLITGEACPVDLGRVNGRYFCTVATAGVDAEVSAYVDSMRVPLRGTIAYLCGALCVLSRYRPRNLRIVGDFGVIDRAVFLASTANTSSYGGAIRIAPGAVPTDGLLDLCIIDQVSKLRALALIPMVLLGRHGSEPEVQLIQTKRLTIDSGDTPIELWADGERIAHTPATIEIVPGAVRVVVPTQTEQAGGVPLRV